MRFLPLILVKIGIYALKLPLYCQNRSYIDILSTKILGINSLFFVKI